MCCLPASGHTSFGWDPFRSPSWLSSLLVGWMDARFSLVLFYFIQCECNASPYMHGEMLYELLLVNQYYCTGTLVCWCAIGSYLNASVLLLVLVSFWYILQAFSMKYTRFYYYTKVVSLARSFSMEYIWMMHLFELACANISFQKRNGQLEKNAWFGIKLKVVQFIYIKKERVVTSQRDTQLIISR